MNTLESCAYITSDLHLGHANIIRHCQRPFDNVEHMDEVLYNNWNDTVGPQDVVYFLGDLTWGRASHIDYWLERLNGDVQFIKGNHDKKCEATMHLNMIIEHDGEELFLTHHERNIPKRWKGWGIHGHYHNNHMDTSPLINNETKRINVSTELTDYKPILLSELLALRQHI